MVIDLSQELRDAVNRTVRDSDLERVDLEDRSELLDRVGLRMILLPSGSSLNSPIRTPAGAMAYGKILFGGATRFRLLSGGKFGTPRRAGERTVIQSKGDDNEKSWLQYGGPERNYEAVDVGPCAIMELIVLPKGLVLHGIHDDEAESEMALSSLGWNPNILFDFFEPSSKHPSSPTTNATMDSAPGGKQGGAGYANVAAGNDQGTVLETTLSSSVGGCRDEISEIVRRACQGRVLSNDLGVNAKECELEAAELAALGLSPIRGVLLWGPPGECCCSLDVVYLSRRRIVIQSLFISLFLLLSRRRIVIHIRYSSIFFFFLTWFVLGAGCGKTVLAREISRALHARPPKIVSAPELLDRWV